MTPGDAVRVLAKAAAFDQRTVGAADAAAWSEALADVDAADALEAVTRHYNETDQRLMPAHIRRLSKMIRDERRREEPHEVRAIAGRFEPDITRDLRMERGVAQCREVIGAVMERLAAGRNVDQPEPSESDLIRQRALEVARAANRGRRS